MTNKPSFPVRTLGTGLVTGAIGYTALGLPIHNAAVAGGVMMAVGATMVIVPPIRWVRHWHSTRATLARDQRRIERHGGTVSRIEHFRVASGYAVRRQATTLRPSLAERSRWERMRTPITEYATRVARESRLGNIYSSCEDVVLMLGGPRTGKTAALACYAIDAPGAVVATSTRPDIVLLTMAMRAKRGPVHIFDPSGTSGLASTIKWSVLHGCKDPKTARRRARDMIPAGANIDEERWNGFARRTLAVLLHAAALSGRNMQDVLRWAAQPREPRIRETVEAALGRSTSHNLQPWRDMSDQFFHNNDRTQTSITTTLLSHLEWLLDDKAAVAGAAVDGEMFSVAELLDQRGTVYLLGTKADQVSPLVAALTGEIAYEARRIAKANGGRLDPPLTMVLDEAAIICPVPLDDWTADMGGFNISLFISAQDPAQLRQVWGPNGASSIVSHAGTLMVFGGIKEQQSLEDWSAQAGARDVVVETKDEHGKVTGATTRRDRVIAPAQIMKLPKHKVLLLRSGLSACLARTPSVWSRKDVRRAVDQSPHKALIETAYAREMAEDSEEENE